MNEMLFEKYMQDKVGSPKTIQAYLFDIGHFISANPEYNSYTYQDVTNYLADLNKQYRRKDGRISTSITRKVAAIKWLYHFLVHIGKRKDHPLPHGFSIKGAKKKGIVFSDLFSPGELDEFFSFVQKENPRYIFAQQRNMVVISLLIYQGLTSEELLCLTVNDIDLSQGVIYIPDTVSGQARNLFFSPVQFMVFQTYLNEGRKKLLGDIAEESINTLIVTSRTQKISSDSIGSIIDKYKLLFPGKRMTAELIRKSVIHNWLNIHKKPLEIVQYWAGHRWPSTTEKYINRINYNDPQALDSIHPMEII